MQIDFLSVDDVLEIHADQIERYGGEHGVRELGLLESAVQQPQAGFNGEYLHTDIYEMAAAYAFHIVQNHPFIDGNKRAGAASSLVFLDINNIEITAPKGSIYDITIAVATGKCTKAEIAEFFRKHSHSS